MEQIMITRPIKRFLICLILFLLVTPLVTLAINQSEALKPEVLKVEPPNWWIKHTINPVRLLIRGKNLSGAKVKASNSGLKIGAVSTNNTGTYLFLDLLIDPKLKPGEYNLNITTSNGSTDTTFELSKPIQSSNNFQGITTDDVIYLIMPDRFSDGDVTNNEPAASPKLYDRSKARYYHGGDFQGIIERLPYLKNLGITAIWLNPIYDNHNGLNEKETYDGKPITDYHGYGAVDFYGVEEHFGTHSKLQELIDKAHSLNIKVIQDQVANHTGPYHSWVKDPPTPTWFNGTENKHLANNWQIWTLMDPKATDHIQQATLEGWFIDILPDLNQNDPEVSRYIIQNTLWWLGMFKFDAIRQDTLPYVPRSFWSKWMAAIKRQYPKLNVVGEVYDEEPGLVSFFQGGKIQFDGIDTRIDTLFDFPLCYAIRRTFAEGRSIKELSKILAHDHLYQNSSILVTFFGLHDMKRFMNEAGATIEGLKLAQTFLMTTRGIPLIYYGDEIAMSGDGDPDNRRDFPGGFPGDKRNAFALDHTSIEKEAYEHLSRLIDLRTELAPLRRGDLIPLYISDQQYAYARKLGKDIVLIAINNGTVPTAIEVDISNLNLVTNAKLVDQLGIAKDLHVRGDRIRLDLPGRSGSIFK
jgi:neopullulanase